MDYHGPMSKSTESLLSSCNEEQPQISLRCRAPHGYTITAIFAVLNTIALLITIGFWLSYSRHHDGLYQAAGAGDMQDAIDAHAVEYEVRSYSRPLEYDRGSRKIVIENHGNKGYVGAPSLEVDAAWDELLRGKFLSCSFACRGADVQEIDSSR